MSPFENRRPTTNPKSLFVGNGIFSGSTIVLETGETASLKRRNFLDVRKENRLGVFWPFFWRDKSCRESKTSRKTHERGNGRTTQEIGLKDDEEEDGQGRQREAEELQEARDAGSQDEEGEHRRRSP
ncbi:MAG: hypothetical protein Q8P67_24660 [archaeon]|nr:hypothetical protein [archaeon]